MALLIVNRKKNLMLASVINSAKLAWKGEEKLWKVFWLWSVVSYILFSLMYIYFVLPVKNKLLNLPTGIILFYMQVYVYVIPVIICILTKRNLRNLYIENKIMKKIILFFLLILFVPFLSLHIFIFGFMPGHLGFAILSYDDENTIGITIWISLVLVFYILFYTNIKINIR